MSVDPGTEVRRAMALLKGTQFVMGTRDKAYDIAVKEALACLERSLGGLGIGPAPAAAEAGLEPSVVEWLFGASDTGLLTAAAMAPDAAAPSREDVLSGALLSIREWASRLLKKPAPPASSGGISTPGGVR